MTEKEKYIDMYSGNLHEKYIKSSERGKKDGGYGRANWGEGITPYLRKMNPKSLCDVGCGYGNFCNMVQEFIPLIYGIDIASVKTGNVIKNNKIIFIDSEAKNIDLPDKAVEWITSFDCLEHCLEEDIDAIVKEFNRIATVGYCLSISPNIDFFHNTQLHMTVKQLNWWIKKFEPLGKVTIPTEYRVPITNAFYLTILK